MNQLNPQKLRVGIPRGLFYYRDFPFWKTFFTALDAQVLVSPKTNTKILEEGISRLTGDVCLPVKTFCGHVLSLTQDCDFLFIPSIYSLEKKAYSCSKFIGLPDLIKSVIGNTPKILDLNINLEKGKESLNRNIYQMAQNFTTDRQKIKLAIEKAEKTQKNFDASLRKENLFLPQALEKLSLQPEGREDFCFPQEKTKEIEDNHQATVGLVGYPYLIYDQYLNHQLTEKLKRMRVKILLPEQVPKEELRTALLKLTDRPYWTFEEEIIGAGGYFLEKKEVDGLICLSSFGCGPDSLMVELLKNYAKDKIFLHLSLDEHIAEAGLITRLEAFVDSLPHSRSRSKKETSLLRDREIPLMGLGQGKKDYYSSFPLQQPKREKIRILGIPNMGEKFSILKKVFKEKFGITLLSPPVTQTTITLGTKHSPEDVCLPFKATLGNLIECLEKGADALLMVTSFNACRMGYYLRVQEKILQDLGYQFRFLKFHSEYRGIKRTLSFIKRLTGASWFAIFSFCFLATAKLRTLDEIEREVQKLRPLEIKKGQADKIYQGSFRVIDEAENIFSLRKIKKEYLKKIREIPRNEKLHPLKVGIVGELYVVAEPFVNMDLEKELGQRGVLVERPKSTFFSEYTRPFHFNPLSQEKKRLEKSTKFYLKRDIGGHGLESLGLKIEYAQKKYDGIIHLMPFTCLPEVVAQNIMISTKEKIPVLTVVCDEELGRAGLITRIEAFVDLLSANSKKTKALL